MSNGIKRRVSRLEGGCAPDDELFDVAGIMMTGAEVEKLLREVARSGNRIMCKTGMEGSNAK